ncbi:MAG: hypothetical protein H8E29_00220 [Anaerolineales bacterium]|uniref:Uncharacterized protein n=1 Tax=Candidatus Desulfolinea nitratireducens TaxID=2841698 RepID=A0A8J6NGI4_9CHLR|nr:hypothetical protein [Candidatus Desulfolinea nitratireducens]
MPGVNDGGSRSSPPMRIIKPTNTMRNGGGARKTRTTGSITEHRILHTGEGIVSSKVSATKNGPWHGS